MAPERRLKIDDILGKDCRTVHVVKLPGTDKDVGLLMLRCSEIADAYFEAREVFRRKGLDVIDGNTLQPLQEELDLQYCYRMLVDPEAKIADARLFKTVDEARARLDTDLRSHFVDLHASKQVERVTSWAPAAPTTEELAS